MFELVYIGFRQVFYEAKYNRQIVKSSNRQIVKSSNRQIVILAFIATASLSRANQYFPPVGPGFFVVTEVSRDETGETQRIYPLSSATTTETYAFCSAGVFGVPGTANARCQGKRTFKIRWAPLDNCTAPPPYTYVCLTSEGSYQATPGGTGTINVPFTDVTPPSDPNRPAREIRKIGRKILKVKLDQQGEALFEVSGSVSVSASASESNGFTAASSGKWGGDATVTMKAIGLGLETFRRAVDAQQLNAGYQVPASTDDFENQEAEVGVSSSESSIPAVAVNRIGIENPGLEFSSGVSEGSRTEITEGLFPRVVTGLQLNLNLSTSDLVAMRSTPKTAIFTATQGESGTVIPGPFKAKLKMKIWANERILTVKNEERIQGRPNAFDATVTRSFVQAGLGFQTARSNGQTWMASGEVSLSRQINAGFSEVVEAGVTMDCGVTLGLQYEEEILDSETYTMDPVSYNRWVYKWTERVGVDAHRCLAAYGSEGYTGDFNDSVSDVIQPYKRFRIHWTPAAPGEGY